MSSSHREYTKTLEPFQVAFMDGWDVVAVAVRTLLDPVAHQGKIDTLTRPAAYPFDQVAAVGLGERGGAIAYRPASIPGYLILSSV